jgi:hypothetical protein
MPETAQTITFAEMKGAIGSLLFLWSDIERALTKAIGKLHVEEVPKSVHGISKSLNHWSLQVLAGAEDRPLQSQLCQRATGMLREALAIRNLVCHGLIGITAQRDLAGDDAHLTVELKNEVRTLTYSELQEMFRWMSRTHWLIGALTDAAIEKDAERANAKLLGWEDFPEQK